MDFLKNLLGKQEQEDPNAEINHIKKLISENEVEMQGPGDKRLNDYYLRQRLAEAQPYPNAPFDPLGDKFNLLEGVTSPSAPTSFQMAPDAPKELPPVITETKEPDQLVKMKSLLSQSRSLSEKPKPQQAPLPEMKEEKIEPKKGESVDDFRKRLIEAQKKKDDDLRSIMLMSGASRIGDAIAGQGRLKYDDSHLDASKAMAGNDLKNLLQEDTEVNRHDKNILDTELAKTNLEKNKILLQDEKARSDANSELSQVSRASVIDGLMRIGRKDLASKITPNMSAKQVEDAFGQYNLANMMTQYEAQQSRNMMMAEKKQLALSTQDSKKDKERDSFITQRYDKLTASKPYEAMSKMQTYKNIIDDALNNPSGVRDISALYAMIKAMDPGSVVKEGELKLFDNAKSVWQKAQTSISKLGKNTRTLDLKSLQEIKAAMDNIYNNTATEYKAFSSPVYKQALSRGIGEDELEKIDPLYSQMKKKDVPQPMNELNIDSDALAQEMKKRGL